MGTWSVKPPNDVTFIPNATSDKVTINFPENKSDSDKIYTVEYDDEKGNCGSMNVRQKPGSGGGGGGVNPVVNISIRIKNNHGSPLTLDGRLRFVIGNPDHNGHYFCDSKYRGDYLRTDNIWFSTSPVSLENGESRTFSNLSWRDADTGCGLGETSPLNPGRLPILDDHGGIAYARNVLIYINERSDQILCDNMSNSIIFQEGQTYDITIQPSQPSQL